MKKKLAALYNPYLPTLGGGEKHTLTLLKSLEDLGYEVHIFWDKNMSEAITERFPIRFHNLIWDTSVFSSHTSLIHRLRVLHKFDTLIYVTDGSYPIVPVKNMLIFCMVPDKKLYRMNIMNRIKTHQSTFICNSHYTQKKLLEWGVRAKVIYPSIDEKYFQLFTPLKQKKKIILSVGRFFPHLHSKRQDKIIDLFKSLEQRIPELNQFELILAGGVQEQDTYYLDSIKKHIGNARNIRMKINISGEELDDLYRTSAFYWHMTGIDVDEHTHPEQVEHLGITPLEAMASGCITLCYGVGGPVEYIHDNENGFLFRSEDELVQKMTNILQNRINAEQIQNNAKSTVQHSFSYDQLRNHMHMLLT